MNPNEQMVDPTYMAMMGQYGQQQMDSLIKYQLDSSEEMELLKAEILGHSWSDDKNGYVRDPNKMQMINEEGANAIMAFLRPRGGKIFSLSNTDAGDIRNRLKHNAKALTKMLVRHAKQFEIPSWHVLTNIIILADDVAYATALKSVRGWEGNSIRKSHQTVEHRETINDNRKKPGLEMGGLFSKFKN